jgi:hypothetical protein
VTARALVLVALAAAPLGCATTPIAFAVSTNAVMGSVPADPEVRSGGSSLQLHFEFSNTTTRHYWICLCAAAIHIESVTRDGQPVPPELLDINLVKDPRAFFKQQLHPLEGEHDIALMSEGLADVRLDHDQWRLVGYKLTRGRYRIVFSYHYEGPDYDHSNVFHDRVVASAVSFNVE